MTRLSFKVGKHHHQPHFTEKRENIQVVVVEEEEEENIEPIQSPRHHHHKMSVEEFYCNHKSHSSMKEHDDSISRIKPPPAKVRKCRFRRFSVDLSTECHFSIPVDELPVFVGAFGHIRKQHLDHEQFHTHYRKERQWLHDSIIEDYLENDSVPAVIYDDDDDEHDTNMGVVIPPFTAQQWLILTVGIQGAGKHFSIRSLREEYTFMLHRAFCCIDADEIRRLLPEYDFYLDHCQELVDDMTRKEAGYIAETLCWAAMYAGNSVLWDTSLSHPAWLAHDLIAQLHKFFPGLKIAILHVVPPSPEAVQLRRELKEQVTGRHVFPDTLEAIQAELNRIQQAVDSLVPAADYILTLCNGQECLELLDGDWDGFLSTLAEESDTRTCPVQDTAVSRLPRLVSEESFVMADNDDSLERPTLQARPSFLLRSSFSNVSTQCNGTNALRRGTSRRRFSVHQSTEQNHCSDDMIFYGRFAQIRGLLDYSYHKNYTFERQRFQDSVIQEFLQGAFITDKDGVVCTTPTEPWIVFTAGPMGAGKSYTMHKLVEHGRFPLEAFVNVDPDELRHHLPEYPLYVNQSPELAGEMTRKEAGYLSEILTLAALQAGKNVLLDGSLRDAEWYKSYFAKLRRDFPILRLAIIQVTAPKETILERAAARAKETGRVVPQSLLLNVYEQVPKSVEILAPLVDYHVTIDNPPNLMDVVLVTPGQTWESFASQWQQTCAWVPTARVQNHLKNGSGSFSKNGSVKKGSRPESPKLSPKKEIGYQDAIT